MSDDKPKLGKIDPILSGNRFGGPQGGSFPSPGGLPSDPYFLELAEKRAALRWGRWRIAALVAIFSLGCVTALFVGATIRRSELESQLATAQLVCTRLPIALQGMRTSIARGNPDDMQIAQRAAAASLLINLILGPCIGDDTASSLYAQRLTEARTSAEMSAVVDEMIGRLR